MNPEQQSVSNILLTIQYIITHVHDVQQTFVRVKIYLHMYIPYM